MWKKFLVGILVISIIITNFSLTETIYGYSVEQQKLPGELLSADGAILIDYIMGKVTNADGLGGNGDSCIAIDGKNLAVEDDFDFNKAAQIWIDGSVAICKLENNIVTEIYSVDEIFSPCVVLKTDPRELSFRNGKISTPKFNMLIEVSLIPNAKFSFLPDNLLKEVVFKISNISIKPTTEGLNFGKDGFWMWSSDIEEINKEVSDSLRWGNLEKRIYKYEVNINSDYKILAAESLLGVMATVTINGKPYEAQGQITVGNLDYQKEEAKTEKTKTDSGRAAKEAKTIIDREAKSNVMLDTKLKNYFSEEQLNTMYEFLYTYSATTMVSMSSKYSEDTKVRDKVYKKLGINTDVLTDTNTLLTSVDYQVHTSEGKMKVHFTVNLGSYNLIAGETYAGMGKVEFAVYKGNLRNPECTGTGTVTYTDVKGFVNSLKSIAEGAIKSGYNIWGNKANQISDYLTEGTLIEALREKNVLGKFSDNLFTVLKNPTEHYIEARVKCPVDVKVYDLNGKLCGSVTDNIVDTSCGEVYISVSGDEKYIYFCGNDYYMELMGSDFGNMDYSIAEYTMDGEMVREINYNDVPLEKNSAYYAAVPEANIYSPELYNLFDVSGNEILATSDSLEQEENTESVSWGLLEDGTLLVYGNGILSLNKEWEHNDIVKKAVFVDGEIEIGRDTFEECKNLETVEMNDCVMKIGYGSFYECPKLSKVTISGKLSFIDGWVFGHCSALKEITIPDSVEGIGAYSINSCRNLEKVVIGTGVKEIGEGAFGFSGLKTIDIPDNVIAIGETAFRECENLERVTIGNGVSKIDRWAFEGCKKLTHLKLGNSVNLEKCRIGSGNGPFRGCDNLVNVEISEGNANLCMHDGMLLSRDKTEVYTALVKKDSYSIPNNVQSIGKNAFNNCRDLKGIVIPDGVKIIEQCAFHFCNNMASITLPKSVTNIEEHAFDYCSALSDVYYSGTSEEWKKIKIDSSNTYLIRAKIHYNSTGPCSHINETIITPATTSKDGSVIQKCTICQEVTEENIIYRPVAMMLMPDSYEYDGNVKTPSVKIRDNQGNILENGRDYVIVYPSGCKDVGTYLVSATLKGNYSGTMEKSFSICEKKSKNIIEDSCQYKITGTNEVAFSGITNKNATTITIPATVKINNITYKVTSVSASAFKNNKKLKKITIPNSIITVGASAFQSCTSLTTIKMGNSVTTIGNKAFYNCKKLTSVSITKNTTTIGNSAFENCVSLKKITVPAKVKKIGNKAFYSCKKLNNLTIQSKKLTAKNVGNKAFTRTGSSAYKKLKVKVPSSKYTTYKKLLQKKGLSAKAKITKK